MKRVGKKLIVCALGLLLIALATPAEAEYFVFNLGTLAGDSSTAIAINDHGEIVGNCINSNGQEHAFYYREGMMRSLSAQFSAASAINESGEIAGSLRSYTTNIFTNIVVNPFTNIIIIPNPPTNSGPRLSIIPVNEAEATFSTQALGGLLPITNGQVVTNLVINSQPAIFHLGAAPNVFEGAGNSGFAAGVNEQGQIVGGVTWLNSVIQYSFVYQKGATTDLPALGSTGEPGAATAINNRGEIVGFSGFQPERCFLYSHGLIQDLGNFGGTESAPTAINDAGEIVGYSTTVSNVEMRAFLYSEGRMIDLGGLPGVHPSPFTNSAYGDQIQLTSHATAINNWGEIVGSALAANGATHAFLYSRGAMTDLNDLVRLTHTNGPPGFLTLISANGINDWGQIVGVGSYWDGKHESGRAFLVDWFP